MRDRDYALSSAMADNGLLSIYTGVACGDGKVALRTLLRNPWFVFTQAPLAARRARALIQRLRVELVERNAAGFLCNVDLCDGRLLLRQGKSLEARQCLDRILSRLQQAGIDPIPAPIAVLAAELEQRAGMAAHRGLPGSHAAVQTYRAALFDSGCFRQ